MNYCSNCGQELKQGADVCLSCGKTITKTASTPSDTGSAGWGVLGFFFPLIGLILYLVWKTDQPKNASSAGKGALIGVIVSVVLSVIYSVLFASLLDDALYYYFNGASYY